MKLFIDHSDCQGGYTREESKRLHTAFLAHHHEFAIAFLEDMMSVYDIFLKIFEIGSGVGGEVVYG
jgi:hypothetical protein